MPEPEPDRPIAVDTRTGTVGEITGTQSGQICLRPLHGGPEWSLDPGRIRRATPEEMEAADR